MLNEAEIKALLDAWNPLVCCDGRRVSACENDRKKAQKALKVGNLTLLQQVVRPHSGIRLKFEVTRTPVALEPEKPPETAPPAPEPEPPPPAPPEPKPLSEPPAAAEKPAKKKAKRKSRKRPK